MKTLEVDWSANSTARHVYVFHQASILPHKDDESVWGAIGHTKPPELTWVRPHAGHQCFGKCNHGGGRVCKVCNMTCHIQRPQAHPSDDRAKNPGTVQPFQMTGGDVWCLLKTRRLIKRSRNCSVDVDPEPWYAGIPVSVFHKPTIYLQGDHHDKK